MPKKKARESEEAVAVAEKKVKEATEFLEKAKSRPGSAQGSIWYMQRELTEKKKYLPKSKQ